jgi:uncharacterized protein YjiS (DUF1127 family)
MAMARLARGVRAPRLDATRLAEPLGSWLRAGLATILHWQELAGQRRALLSMDERLLKDIGLTRTEARHVAARIPGDEMRRRLGRAAD